MELPRRRAIKGKRGRRSWNDLNGQTLQECQEFLEREIRKVEAIPPSHRQSKLFVRRHIFLYGWMLQGQSDIINREELAVLIGPSLRQTMDVIIDIDLVAPYVDILNADFIRFTPEMMEAIAVVFDEPEFKYHINQQVPCFEQGVTSSKLIEYFNLLEESPGEPLVDAVLHALQRALPGIEARVVDPDLPYLRLVFSPDDGWNFLLAVYPQFGALSPEQARGLLLEVFGVREELELSHDTNQRDFVPVLVFTSSIDSEDVEFIGGFKSVYYAWSMTVLRFFHLLQDAVGGRKELARQVFMSIFVDQDGIAFSSSLAINALKREMEKKTGLTTT